MKTPSCHLALPALLLLSGCPKAAPEAPAAVPAAPAAPKESALPPVDENNIVSIAAGSPAHKTLVAALKAADYAVAVANPGPLTVFAPTDEAFAKLPAGTVESLVKPENHEKLREILKHHVTPSTYDKAAFTDGQVLSMVNGKVTIHVKDGKVTVNDANVTASIRASNGIVHVIDAVLLPK